eukprot:scpid40646/ scgid22450/ 
MYTNLSKIGLYLNSRPESVLSRYDTSPADCLQHLQWPTHLSSEMSLLAQQLPTVLEGARAKSTVKKYKASFTQWQRWAKGQGISALPADPLHVALYLVKKIATSSTPAPVSAAAHGISWKHNTYSHPDPCRVPMVQRVHQAAKRFLATQRRRKAPLTPKLLKKLKVSLSTGKLQDLQTLTLVTLGFAGFLRWDDLAHVRIDALSIHRDYMAVFLECRKNDQFREGSWVFIS